MENNKIIQCIVCGAVLTLIISEASPLCQKCLEKNHVHVSENNFAHESLLNYNDFITIPGSFSI